MRQQRQMHQGVQPMLTCRGVEPAKSDLAGVHLSDTGSTIALGLA